MIDVAPDSYDQWNALLLKEYFGAANHGERVWVQAIREELDDFGFRHGGTSGLLEAIASGPSWSNYSWEHISLVVRFLINQRKNPTSRMAAYRDPGFFDDAFAGRNAPAYMPYVALFVLAASEAGPDGYYSRVSELSGCFFESSE